jgi:hypothetical protein
MPQDALQPATDSRFIRARQRRQQQLPCGAPECVHCHEDCGVAMAAYLSDWEENEITQPTPEPKSSTAAG